MATRAPQVIDGVTIEQLVAFADGTLPEPERVAVADRIAASLDAQELLRAQRRALAATRSFDPPPPPGYALADDTRAAVPRLALTRRQPWLVGAAMAALVALVVLAIVLAPGDRGGTIDAMAAISARPSLELPAPVDAGEGELRRSFAGVTFPEWQQEHGWRAIGARRAAVGGRSTDTVFYQHTHHRIGYTVLSGKPVPLPLRGRRVERNGMTVQLFRDGVNTVAVFERAGRTCVLAGVVHREETIVKLATWRPEGALRF